VRLGRKCHSIWRPAASPNVSGNCIRSANYFGV